MKHELTAKRLQIAMSNMNINAQELSNRSGVAKASISQYVNGSHKPSNISSGKMASVLNVNPLWLMGFDVSMQTEENDSVEPCVTITNDDGVTRTFNMDSIIYNVVQSLMRLPLESQEMIYDVVEGQERRSKKVIYVKNPQNEKPAKTIQPHLLQNAAHDRTDKKVTEADIKHDEDIMNDDNF